MAMIHGGCDGQAQKIISLTSKCLILVIGCNISTLMLAVVICTTILFQSTILTIVIHRIVAATDVFVAIFAVYSHFAFGEWLYFGICSKCHYRVESHCLQRIRATSVDPPTATTTPMPDL